MSSPAIGGAETPVAVSVTCHPHGASSPWMWVTGGAVCGAVTTLATPGMGSGAIAVGLMGIVGGYALCGRGGRWPRVVCGAAGVGFTAALAATVAEMTDPPLSLTDPRGAWAAVLAASLYPVLALGCSISLRSAWSRLAESIPIEATA